MPDVFISYASLDQPSAYAILEAIEGAGVTCWIAPRNIPGLSTYAEEIIKGIEQCRVMIVVLSTHANQSDFVAREVERAASRGLPILPFRIEDVKPSKSLELFLSSTQWLDGFPGSVDAHTDRLVRDLEAKLAGQAPRPPSLRPHPTPPKMWTRVAAIIAAAIVTALLAYALIKWRPWEDQQRESPVPEGTPVLSLEVPGRAIDPANVVLVGVENLVLNAVDGQEIKEDALIEHAGFEVTSSMTTERGRKWTLQQQKPLLFESHARFVVKGERGNGALSCAVKRELPDRAVGLTKIDGKLTNDSAEMKVFGWETDIEITVLGARRFAKVFASLVDDTGAVVVNSIPLTNANASSGSLIGHLVLPEAARRPGKRFLIEVTAQDAAGAQRTAKTRRPLIEFAPARDAGDAGPRTSPGTYAVTSDSTNPCRYTVNVRGLAMVWVTRVFVDGVRNPPRGVKITPPWSPTAVAMGVSDRQDPWSGTMTHLNGHRKVDGDWILEVQPRPGQECPAVSVTTLRIEYVP